MNKVVGQKGNARLVIIIVVIAVVILGLAGYFVWTKVLNKPVASTATKATTAQTATTSKTDSKSALPAVPPGRTSDDDVVLADWSVKFKLQSGADEVTYYEVPETKAAMSKGYDANYYEFSTKKVEALGQQCVAPGVDGVVTRLATLSRSRTKLTVAGADYLNNDTDLNGFYYYLVSGTSTCSTDNTTLQTSDRAMITSAVKNLELL